MSPIDYIGGRARLAVTAFLAQRADARISRQPEILHQLSPARQLSAGDSQSPAMRQAMDDLRVN